MSESILDPHQEDIDLTTVRKHVDALMEHFDTVQVLCTRCHDNVTIDLNVGRGNIHARVGHAAMWVRRETE